MIPIQLSLSVPYTVTRHRHLPQCTTRYTSSCFSIPSLSLCITHIDLKWYLYLTSNELVLYMWVLTTHTLIACFTAMFLKRISDWVKNKLKCTHTAYTISEVSAYVPTEAHHNYGHIWVQWNKLVRSLGNEPSYSNIERNNTNKRIYVSPSYLFLDLLLWKMAGYRKIEPPRHLYFFIRFLRCDSNSNDLKSCMSPIPSLSLKIWFLHIFLQSAFIISWLEIFIKHYSLWLLLYNVELSCDRYASC